MRARSDAPDGGLAASAGGSPRAPAVEGSPPPSRGALVLSSLTSRLASAAGAGAGRLSAGEALVASAAHPAGVAFYAVAEADAVRAGAQRGELSLPT